MNKNFKDYIEIAVVASFAAALTIFINTYFKGIVSFSSGLTTFIVSFTALFAFMALAYLIGGKIKNGNLIINPWYTAFVIGGCVLYGPSMLYSDKLIYTLVNLLLVWPFVLFLVWLLLRRINRTNL